MTQLLARDLMTKEVISLRPEQTVTEAAKVLAKNHIGGAPVVDDGRLVGIISESDLIIQDVKLHFPTYVHLLDSYIYLGSLAKFEAELKKAVGAKVKDLMTPDVLTVNPETTVEETATILADNRLSRIPVLEDGRIVGIVTKGDIVRSLYRE